MVFILVSRLRFRYNEDTANKAHYIENLRGSLMYISLSMVCCNYPNSSYHLALTGLYLRVTLREELLRYLRGVYEDLKATTIRPRANSAAIG